MFESPRELWWNQIHGPRLLRDQIEQHLLTPRKGLWIYGEVPWPETLRQMVTGRLGEKDVQTCLTCLEAKALEGLAPTDLIFQLNPAAKSRYMPSIPLAKYICDNQLLETHILWLTGLTEERHRIWLDLSRDLARLKTSFQIVCQGRFPCKKNANIALVRTEAYFTDFDRILFALQLAAESGASLDLQMYGSYLAVELTGGQEERIPALMENPVELAENPESRAEGLGQERLAQAQHNAQVKVLLPALEARQERLVDELSDLLRQAMPFKDEYGREYHELYEVELRNMRHLCTEGKLPLTPQQKQRLDQLYRLRNLVAHRKIVPGETVVEFLR